MIHQIKQLKYNLKAFKGITIKMYTWNKIITMINYIKSNIIM